MKYPIECYGMRFNSGYEFHDFVSALYSKKAVSQKERLVLEYTYDNGFLAHPDWKALKSKAVQEQKIEGSKGDE